MTDLTVADLVRLCEENGWDPSEAVVFVERNGWPCVARQADSLTWTAGGRLIAAGPLLMEEDDG